MIIDETTDLAEKKQLSVCVRDVNMEKDKYQVNKDISGKVEVEQTDSL